MWTIDGIKEKWGTHSKLGDIYLIQSVVYTRIRILSYTGIIIIYWEILTILTLTLLIQSCFIIEVKWGDFSAGIGGCTILDVVYDSVPKYFIHFTLNMYDSMIYIILEGKNIQYGMIDWSILVYKLSTI